ncbi:MAG: hypothetical protein HY553_22830, partial [Elusimicrobia bacterium]|nr:hypothetical protein [Elusimicrobiota bacterium]
MIQAALIVALAAVPAFAAPSLEQMKADSGIRFSELSGVGPVKADASPVWAGGERGRRVEFTRADRPALTAQTPPPPPAPPAPNRPKKSGTSLGAKLLTGAGYLTGALATTLGGPVLLAALAAGGG